jgi:hypothetical protein
MRIQMISRVVVVSIALLGLSALGYAKKDDATTVKKAVERSTLNQPGTKPFHLKATLALSYERDRGSNRTGEIEIWWASPTQWKKEVRCPGFHQIVIANNGKEWQKNEGDYFPEWLRETAQALIEPVPSLEQVLKQVQDADVKRLLGNTYFSWMMMSTDGTVQKGMGGGVAITDSTGLLMDGYGFGWGAGYRNYKSFHGRMVARTVNVGSPEVTAKVATLEDLGIVPPGFFDTQVTGGDSPLLQTLVVDEISLRKNLLPAEPVVWSPIKDGPLQGVISTEVVIDRAGKVREIGTIVSDNPALSETFGKTTAALQFKPYLQEGVPVQVVSRITMPFKTTRPTGMETFDSAQNYFERGRRISFPAAGNGQAYVLHATFRAKVVEGTVKDGQYVDTWKSDSEWRREATIGKSRCVRARHGETRYQLLEGPDVGLLRLILKVMEPIPAIDTFVESDWRIKRDILDGIKTIRVLAGYESSDGTLDPKQARGYWFDESGKLVKTYFIGLETRRLEFAEFSGVQIAHKIPVLQNGALGILVTVTEVSAAGTLANNIFELPGHEWKRAFTDEVR